VDYKDTVNLPKTAFPMKANLPQREPEILRQWEEQAIFQRLVAQNAGRNGPRFVLHDGPPYANGDIHIGHALNKILKDIVVKYRNMRGDVADYIPGWDCHGLPIELKVDKELGPKKRDMDKAQIIEACRKYAQKWIDKQRESFKRLGVFGRWATPYATMARGYEAETVRAFARAAERGFLFRGKKPVYWCTTDRTALAEAEVEYEDHSSPSIYLAFDLTTPLPAPQLAGKKARLVIWTTTPWTLPANLAVAAHPQFTYVAYELRGQILVVAKDLLGQFLAAIGGGEVDPAKILATFDGKALEGLQYEHPFMGRRCPVILGDHVTLEAGTGLVHTAPGHGQEDYVVGLKYGLEILNPVDGAGRFTAEAGKYAGKEIFATNQEIVDDLHASGHLLSDPKAKLSHSYPHCWRCHKPVVFRATDQWFLSLDHRDLRKRALTEIDEQVRWIPRWGRDRIFNMIQNRPDWCLSRQRTWGVPIPVFYCQGCEEPLLSQKVMEQVARAFEEEGVEAWYRRTPAQFTQGEACPKCGKAEFRREQDILDVWWDSGVSWAAVCEKEGLTTPVDLYLEGSDQHRGWFHSALLTCTALEEKAPYKAVLTHGFLLDQHGKAMSKSAGNGIEPQEIIKKYGADILRMWVSASDYRDDVTLSEQILAGVAEGYRKIRNTIRYVLGALDGYDPKAHAVPVEELLPIDRWALARLAAWDEKVTKAYEDYEFHVAYHATIQFCAVELSAQYFDIIKDRLYTWKKDGKARRSALTVLHAVAEDLIRLLAPVLSFTASEAWSHLPTRSAESVFLAGLPKRARPADADALEERYGKLFEVRAAVQGKLEEARKAKLIGSGLEAAVVVRAEGDTYQRLLAAKDELATLFIVSGVELAEGPGPVGVEVKRAGGVKCERCWIYRDDVGADPKHPTVCAKCADALA
jgi:isoleucyl-tRNA synthetase